MPGDGAPEPIDAALTAEEVLSRLESMAKRGKLPGFERRAADAFRVAQFGIIYDRVLDVRIEPGDRGGSRIRFTSTLLRRSPAVVVIVMLLTLYPGVWLTHSMLGLYFNWYPSAFWVTAAWYIPLTLLAVPVLIRQFRASEAAAAEHGRMTARRIAKELGAGG
ncbi:MAG: hypothetical protein IBJ11_11280 [Phycisphaerales bacterium]|nr:hypothetical protein [Phycisphaerales bacterium]